MADDNLTRAIAAYGDACNDAGFFASLRGERRSVEKQHRALLAAIEASEPQPDITAWAAGAFGASPELTAAWLAVMEAGIKSGEMPGWRPIETAPKDEMPVLVARSTNGDVFDAWWSDIDAGWIDGTTDAYDEPFQFEGLSHWQPLPAAPDPKQDRSRADETGGE